MVTELKLHRSLQRSRVVKKLHVSGGGWDRGGEMAAVRVSSTVKFGENVCVLRRVGGRLRDSFLPQPPEPNQSEEQDAGDRNED